MFEHERQELFERIKRFALSEGGADTFEALCLGVFDFQYRANEAYMRYCQMKGKQPQNVSSYMDIPAYPTEGFKKDIVVSFPLDKSVMEHITGGTTHPELRGSVFRDEFGRQLALALNRHVIGKYVFPENKRMSILVLTPSPETTPTMGMALGMAETIKHFGDDGSGFFITRRGMKTKELLKAMRNAEGNGRPVAVIGATGAFIYLFNACRKQGVRFCLPRESRIIDGGGYRGRFGECSREMYYEQCQEFLGIPEEYCLNVLGMAECTTNFADNALRNFLSGADEKRYKPYHRWARVKAYDMETCSRPLPDGEVGLLRHFDLANLPTVVAIQTENLGYVSGDGFEIVGRAKVVDGKVTPLPSEKPVGPMGNMKIFPFLDAYIKFSITRNVKKLRKEEGLACTCGEAVENIIAGSEDKDSVS